MEEAAVNERRRSSLKRKREYNADAFPEFNEVCMHKDQLNCSSSSTRYTDIVLVACFPFTLILDLDSRPITPIDHYDHPGVKQFLQSCVEISREDAMEQLFEIAYQNYEENPLEDNEALTHDIYDPIFRKAFKHIHLNFRGTKQLPAPWYGGTSSKPDFSVEERSGKSRLCGFVVEYKPALGDSLFGALSQTMHHGLNSMSRAIFIQQLEMDVQRSIVDFQEFFVICVAACGPMLQFFACFCIEKHPYFVALSRPLSVLSTSDVRALNVLVTASARRLHTLYDFLMQAAADHLEEDSQDDERTQLVRIENSDTVVRAISSEMDNYCNWTLLKFRGAYTGLPPSALFKSEKKNYGDVVIKVFEQGSYRGYESYMHVHRLSGVIDLVDDVSCPHIGLHALVFPYCRGSSEIPIKIENRLYYLLKVREILEHVHNHGVVHGDLHIGNILYDESTGAVTISLSLSRFKFINLYN